MCAASRSGDLNPTENIAYIRNIEYLQAIIDNMIDGVMTLDTSGTITSWNRACISIFGYNADDVIGRNLSTLLHEPDTAANNDNITPHLQETQRETTGRRKDGTTFPIELYIRAVDNGDMPTFIGIIRDISERKQSEDLLKKSNTALDDFVYIVSHDLKEPLRGIYFFSRFLFEDYGQKMDEEGRDKLQVLEKLSRRMEDLIDSLLLYSRIERVHLALRETDINAVVQETIELMDPLINKPNVKILVNTNLPKVVCDAAHATEIFRNLITNGLKYNDRPAKEIEIGATCKHPEYPGIPVFFVRDNGIGISDGHRHDVFKMFKRLHAANEYGGGTGSGLTIVRKIVERHNGRVWVESDGTSGSTFYFTLCPYECKA